MRVEFYDNGVGIKREDLSKVFDPFFTTRRETGGTGLGLSVSFGIIRDFGGTINVESEEGKFTRFTIELSVSRKRGRLNMPNVLLVDDEPSIRLTMGEFLKRAGYSVLTAADFDSAAMLKAEDLDVAVVDINLPGKNGIELLQKLMQRRNVRSRHHDYGRTEPFGDPRDRARGRLRLHRETYHQRRVAQRRRARG